MAEFNLSARWVYGGGERGEVLARVSGASGAECLAAIAAEVEILLLQARRVPDRRVPRELELRLAWREPEHSPNGRTPAPPRPRSGARIALGGGRALRRRVECPPAPPREGRRDGEGDAHRPGPAPRA